MRKYELTDNYDYCQGRKVFQIRALRKVRDGVYPGDLGGWIESEDNLSQEGGCWVENVAITTDESSNEYVEIYGTTRITGDEHIAGSAKISCNKDILCISEIGNNILTFFKTENGIVVSYGQAGDVFFDSVPIDEFEKEMDRLHHGEQKEEYALAVKLAKLQLLSNSDGTR